MLDADHRLATALGELDKLDTGRHASLEDLVALSTARDCIEELFRACTEQLLADPEISPVWEAIASAIKLPAQKKTPAQKAANFLSESDEQVLAFWNTFADRFTWDFLPADFLHGLYEHWLTEQYPHAVAFSKTALTRRLKSAAARSGDWFHTRDRPGTLMAAHEPLAARVPHWRHNGSDAAIYGLRRSGV